jgi:ketosteroid isomerase-like protein
MSRENVERAERAVAAINETYRTGDIGPWRRFVDETCDEEIVVTAPGDAFTEGEWRGREGVVRFLANQMEVLDDMWLRIDEYLHDADDCVAVAVTFGGRARHTGLEVELHPLHVFPAARWTGGRMGDLRRPRAGPRSRGAAGVELPQARPGIRYSRAGTGPRIG